MIRFRPMRRSPAFGMLLFLSVLLGMAALSPAYAQPSGARGDDFIYRILQGDTLINVSSRFTGTPDNWPTLQSLNNVVDPYALPIGLELRIPFALIPEVEAQAQITHIIGQVFVNHQPARPTATLNEGDILETAEHSFATFQLPDGSTSALPPETVVHIQRLRTFLGTGLVDAILQLDQGDVEATVAPDGQGTGRYEVRTPVSITGVRGTRLRVRTHDQGAHTEVLSGSVQLGLDDADGPQLASRQGTVVTAEGRILPPRTLLSAPVLRTDPEQPHSRTVLFDPVPGAVAYHVRVAADASGTQPVWTDTVTHSPIQYRTPGGGSWHVLVRAIDDVGLMSDDTVLEVEGRRVLISGYGLNVNNGFGEPVLLSDY